MHRLMMAAVLAAAVAFLASDLFVARDRFVERDWRNRAVGLPLYYVAQLVFATLVPTARLDPG